MTQTFSPGSMHAIIPAGCHGDAEVIHDTPDPFTRLRNGMRGMDMSQDKYTRLLVNGIVWMTDTEFEWRSNLEAVHKLKGDVLIAGLGIGFIIQPLVGVAASITVIEQNADVIALVGPYFPSVNFIQADARTYVPPRKTYDAVYLDIWADIPNSDDWEDINALKKRYRPSLRRGGWIGAWCEDRAKGRH